MNLAAGRTVKGIDTAFDTFVSLLAIAYGLLASTYSYCRTNRRREQHNCAIFGGQILTLPVRTLSNLALPGRSNSDAPASVKR